MININIKGGKDDSSSPPESATAIAVAHTSFQGEN